MIKTRQRLDCQRILTHLCQRSGVSFWLDGQPVSAAAAFASEGILPAIVLTAQEEGRRIGLKMRTGLIFRSSDSGALLGVAMHPRAYVFEKNPSGVLNALMVIHAAYELLDIQPHSVVDLTTLVSTFTKGDIPNLSAMEIPLARRIVQPKAAAVAPSS